MGSGGKKKTTMAKLAREQRLRERRLTKEAKKEARKHAASDHADVTGDPLDEAIAQTTPSRAAERPAPAAERAGAERSSPDDKDAALRRLRDASDEELAVFETNLRADALVAGATESEMRAAQRNHPGHAGDFPTAI